MTNPATINFPTGTINYQDRKLIQATHITTSSGNGIGIGYPMTPGARIYLEPNGSSGGIDNFILHTVTNSYPYTPQTLDFSSPILSQQSPTGFGVSATLNSTSLTLNSATYLSGTGITIDAGQYVSASFPNKLYLKNMGNSNYDLYSDSALTNPVTHSDWDVSDTQFDADLTIKWDNNEYKVYDSAGNLNSTDVLVKLRNTTSNVNFTDVISDLSVNNSYVAGSDGILYTDDAKTTQAISNFTNVYIDEMIDLADHSYYPHGPAGGNRYWQEIKR